jgi:hypothetical protein
MDPARRELRHPTLGQIPKKSEARIVPPGCSYGLRYLIPFLLHSFCLIGSSAASSARIENWFGSTLQAHYSLFLRLLRCTPDCPFRERVVSWPPDWEQCSLDCILRAFAGCRRFDPTGIGSKGWDRWQLSVHAHRGLGCSAESRTGEASGGISDLGL